MLGREETRFDRSSGVGVCQVERSRDLNLKILLPMTSRLRPSAAGQACLPPGRLEVTVDIPEETIEKREVREIVTWIN